MAWFAGYFPNRLLPPTVRRELMSADSTHPLATKRLVIGHLTVCQGCCCGNTENGRPPVPVDWLKREWRARGLLKRVQLTISGCLGPCDLPNVVTISNGSGTQWFGEITEFEQYRDLVDWAARSRDAGELLPLPRDFQRHTLHPFHRRAGE
jgi:cobaltochelatase CobN